MMRPYSCLDCPPDRVHDADPRGPLPKRCPDHRGRGSVLGKRHPQNRAYRNEYRAPPERFTSRMDAWRKRARALLCEWGFWTGQRVAECPSAVVLWEGPSRLKPKTSILVIATSIRDKSVNPKTNDMVQVYIILRDVHPTMATRTGADAAVCGNCRFRPKKKGGCYTNTSWAPANLWRRYREGALPTLSPSQSRRLLTGGYVRFGAYGDPATAPLYVWRPLVQVVRGHNSYTHQWEDLDDRWHWCMASVDTPAEFELARARGWRTFRSLTPIETMLPGERACPAISAKVTCLACNGCNGNDAPGRVSYALQAHGPGTRTRIWTTCPTCGAKPGKPCINTSQLRRRRMKTLHRTRRASGRPNA
jgi:hypothetical protein